MTAPVLEVRSLSKNFGGLRALNDVDLDIAENEIVALIGPNGAGKTTFINGITGIYEPTEGTVRLQPRSRMGSGASAGSPAGEQPDQDDAPARALLLNGRKPHEVTRLGMARTFQNIRLFPTMTVLENVMIGRHCRTRGHSRRDSAGSAHARRRAGHHRSRLRTAQGSRPAQALQG